MSVTCIGSSISVNMPPDTLHPLTRQESEFLLALESFEERLKAIVHPEALEQAVELTVGSEVRVEQKDEWLRGVLRYIGPLSEPRLLDPIAGVFFGVELQVSSSLFCVHVSATPDSLKDFDSLLREKMWAKADLMQAPFTKPSLNAREIVPFLSLSPKSRHWIPNRQHHGLTS